MVRATTNGVLKNYRSDLMNSSKLRNDAMETVLTQRNFNSWAEDPAAAAQCFQLRRSFLRTDSQISLSDSAMRKFRSAYSSLESVVDIVDNQRDSTAWEAVLYAANSPTGAGRVALGQELNQLADSILQSMNVRYGDTYIFSGADGLKVPFEWVQNTDGSRSLAYRGIATDTAKADDLEKLDYLSTEARYIDIGLGLQEDENDQLITASAFNDSMPGIAYLGYGQDADGDPKNVVEIIDRLGDILCRCNPDSGAWAENTTDQEDFQRLSQKLEDAADELQNMHVELTTKADFLENNTLQLMDTAYTLNEQIMGIEKVDLAEAITSYSWAQYCYNAALKTGSSILGESLMDFLSY